MPIIVSNCPRCSSTHVTFDVTSYNDLGTRYNWQRRCELFSVCRNCYKATTFVVSQKTDTGTDTFRDPSKVMKVEASLNNFFSIERFVSLRDHSIHTPPEFVPEQIDNIFREGAACLSIECWNAAGTMFRQCLDIATKSMLPKDGTKELSKHQKKYLAPRIDWLIENQLIPNDLKELATCIREDGNDGAHDGTLGQDEAMDLLDFTIALLERIYTMPGKIQSAEAKRLKRRAEVN